MWCECCDNKPGEFRLENGWNPNGFAILCDECHEYNDGEFTIGGVTWMCEFCGEGVNNCHCEVD